MLIFVSSLFFIFLCFFSNFSCVIFAVFVKFLKENIQDPRTEKSWKNQFHRVRNFRTVANFRIEQQPLFFHS